MALPLRVSVVQVLQSFQNRIALAEAQCQTHWELLCRIHDLVVVFDLAGGCPQRRPCRLLFTLAPVPAPGIVVFVSPVCEQILQYKPEELFNRCVCLPVYVCVSACLSACLLLCLCVCVVLVSPSARVVACAGPLPTCCLRTSTVSLRRTFAA